MLNAAEVSLGIQLFYYVTGSGNSNHRPLRRTLVQHIANQQGETESQIVRKSVRLR